MKFKNNLACALLASILFPSLPALSEDNGAKETSNHYTARYAKKYGAKWGVYTTVDVNHIPAVPGFSEGKAIDQDPNSKKAYYEVANFSFTCPGYSFINGVISKYDERDRRLSDRSFRFSCAFLESDQGDLLKKSSCSKDSSELDNKMQKNGSSSCGTDQFIHSMDSQKFLDNKYQDDRAYKTSCCSIEDQNKKILKNSGECKNFTFRAGESFEMTCPQDMIVNKITSTWYENTKDRSYSFTCCKAEFKD